MQNILFSVITPMYNSFELMHRYFESLEQQTYKDFEVVIIDDSSNDGSYEKLCEYVKKSSLNISIRKTDKNGGPGNARNLGMDIAWGEWITFIDNDDWVDINLFQEIKAIIEKENVNCVVYDYYTTDGKKSNIQHSMYKGNTGITSMHNCMMYVRNHAVGKFYKRDCLSKLKYPLLRRCEDVAFVCRAIDACGSVFYLKKPLYYYYQRNNSLSNNLSLDENDMVKAFGILEKNLKHKYPDEIKEKSVSDLLYGGLLIICKSQKNSRYINRYIDDYEIKYPNWYKCENVNNLGKAKKIFLLAARGRQIVLLKILAWIHSRLVG